MRGVIQDSPGIAAARRGERLAGYPFGPASCPRQIFRLACGMAGREQSNRLANQQRTNTGGGCSGLAAGNPRRAGARSGRAPAPTGKEIKVLEGKILALDRYHSTG